jgi:hypothetical protein
MFDGMGPVKKNIFQADDYNEQEKKGPPGGKLIEFDKIFHRYGVLVKYGESRHKFWSMLSRKAGKNCPCLPRQIRQRF